MGSIIVGLYLIVSVCGMSVLQKYIKKEDRSFGVFIFGILVLPVLVFYELLVDGFKRGDDNE